MAATWFWPSVGAGGQCGDGGQGRVPPTLQLSAAGRPGAVGESSPTHSPSPASACVTCATVALAQASHVATPRFKQGRAIPGLGRAPMLQCEEACSQRRDERVTALQSHLGLQARLAPRVRATSWGLALLPALALFSGTQIRSQTSCFRGAASWPPAALGTQLPSSGPVG